MSTRRSTVQAVVGRPRWSRTGFMINEPRRHHYLPQFYLSGFTDENGESLRPPSAGRRDV